MARKQKKIPEGEKRSSGKRKSSLTVEQLRYFQKMLLIKRRELIGDVNNIEGEALKKSRLDASGDLSSMPIHMADIGTDNYEQEFSIGLMDSDRKLLKKIDEALNRIGKGTYGICEATGKPISRARLKAQPWARYCVQYAKKLEQGIVEEQ